MSIPQTMTERVAIALAVMRKHPYHNLSWNHRHAIYQAFKVDPVGQQARIWLDILTTHYVLPQWEAIRQSEIWEDYDEPKTMVQLAEDVLMGKTAPSVGREMALHWSEVSDLSGETLDSPYYNAWCVFKAALTTVWLAVGWDCFENPDPESVPTTDHISEWVYGDTAEMAMLAYVGGTWTPVEGWTTGFEEQGGEWDRETPEAQARRQAFWEWWLLEAIPQAWEQAVHETKEQK
jgi:hypothetical protein